MIRPKGDYSTLGGKTHPILIMDENEIKERADLNVANTASALRRKVLEHLATGNGHSPSSR